MLTLLQIILITLAIFLALTLPILIFVIGEIMLGIEPEDSFFYKGKNE